MIWFACMYETPCRICLEKHAHARSVRTNSSSITRSKSSPPPMLGKTKEGKKINKTLI